MRAPVGRLPFQAAWASRAVIRIRSKPSSSTLRSRKNRRAAALPQRGRALFACHSSSDSRRDPVAEVTPPAPVVLPRETLVSRPSRISWRQLTLAALRQYQPGAVGTVLLGQVGAQRRRP